LGAGISCIDSVKICALGADGCHRSSAETRTLGESGRHFDRTENCTLGATGFCCGCTYSTESRPLGESGYFCGGVDSCALGATDYRDSAGNCTFGAICTSTPIIIESSTLG